MADINELVLKIMNMAQAITNVVLTITIACESVLGGNEKKIMLMTDISSGISE